MMILKLTFTGFMVLDTVLKPFRDGNSFSFLRSVLSITLTLQTVKRRLREVKEYALRKANEKCRASL